MLVIPEKEGQRQVNLRGSLATYPSLLSELWTSERSWLKNKTNNNNKTKRERVGQHLRNNLTVAHWPPCTWRTYPCTCTQTGIYTCAYMYMAETKFAEVKTRCYFWASLCHDSNHALCKAVLSKAEGHVYA